MKFVSFASSSRGNCAFISYKNTNILVDCGISKKRIIENLSKYGKTLDDIDCILITHEHEDHISGLPMVLKNTNIKVLSQKATLMKISEYCESKGTVVNLDNFKILRSLNSGDEDNYIEIKDIKMYPIKGFHDVPSLFYKFILDDLKLAILTDMGKYTEYIIRSIADVNYLMLECNYDEEMLMQSEKYKPFLKNRIRGEGGHLSNVDCANIIMQIASDTLKKVYLSHISDETNNEEYALEFVSKYLKENYNGVNKLPEIDISRRLEETIII